MDRDEHLQKCQEAFEALVKYGAVSALAEDVELIGSALDAVDVSLVLWKIDVIPKDQLDTILASLVHSAYGLGHMRGSEKCEVAFVVRGADDENGGAVQREADSGSG